MMPRMIEQKTWDGLVTEIEHLGFSRVQALALTTIWWDTGWNEILELFGLDAYQSGHATQAAVDYVTAKTERLRQELGHFTDPDKVAFDALVGTLWEDGPSQIADAAEEEAGQCFIAYHDDEPTMTKRELLRLAALTILQRLDNA